MDTGHGRKIDRNYSSGGRWDKTHQFRSSSYGELFFRRWGCSRETNVGIPQRLLESTGRHLDFRGN